MERKRASSERMRIENAERALTLYINIKKEFPNDEDMLARCKVGLLDVLSSPPALPCAPEPPKKRAKKSQPTNEPTTLVTFKPGEGQVQDEQKKFMFDSTADIVAFMDEKGLPYNLLKTLSAMFPKQLSMREIQCAVDLVLRRKEESPVAVDTVLCMMSKCSSKIHVPYSNGDGQWFAQVLADANFHLGVNQLDASGFVSVGLVLFMFGKANKVTNEMVKELKDQLALKYSRQNIDDGKELYAKQRYSSALMDMVVERRLREYREQQTSV